MGGIFQARLFEFGTESLAVKEGGTYSVVLRNGLFSGISRTITCYSLSCLLSVSVGLTTEFNSEIPPPHRLTFNLSSLLPHSTPNPTTPFPKPIMPLCVSRAAVTQASPFRSEQLRSEIPNPKTGCRSRIPPLQPAASRAAASSGILPAHLVSAAHACVYSVLRIQMYSVAGTQ